MFHDSRGNFLLFEMSLFDHHDYIRRQSPQLEKRSQLVDWTADVAEKLGLQQSSLHLAVKLIDIFMDGHDIQVLIINEDHRQNVSTSFFL